MIGTTLSHYKITAKLGEGGMGEVYRADDTQLGREVAIKVLPEAMAADPERMARFSREAQVLASLNHPNIAAIYGLEETEGRRALVMELVEGETLGQIIARGPISSDLAIPVAVQIAQALEAAHEKGIIHRDLKPANVKITPDGTAKVLDFGLAKATEPTSMSGIGSASMSPTLTQDMTAAGIILGTASYMSPEQARGQVVDKRSDNWAFGSVLFEMLSGKRAFAGETVTDILGAIVHKQPEWSELPGTTPAGVRKVLQRCLVNDPKQRLHDIADARIELQEAAGLSRPHEPVSDLAPTPASAISPRGLLIGALLGLAVGLGLYMLLDPRSSQAPQASGHFSLQIPPDIRAVGNPMISPQGDYLVFWGLGDRARLYERRLDDFTIREIEGTEGVGSHAISPDGRWIAFLADNKLKKINRAGGSPIVLTDLNSILPGVRWGPGDTLLFSRGWIQSGLYSIPASGGEAKALTEPDYDAGEIGHWWAETLPDEKWVLFTIWTDGSSLNDSKIGAVNVESGEKRVLFPGADADFLSSGHLLYYHGGSYFVAPFDPVTLERTGPEVLVLPEAARRDPNGGTDISISVSDNGTLTYVPEGPLRRLSWFDRDGTQTPWPFEPDRFTDVQASPTDGRVTVSILKEGAYQIWIFDPDRRTQDPFTSNSGSAWDGVWHPDGKQIAYTALSGGTFDIQMQLSGQEPEVVVATDLDDIVNSFSPDGATLIFQRLAEGADTDVWAVNLADPAETRVVVSGPMAQSDGRISPDGRWLAYTSTESGKSEVYVQPYPGPGARTRVSTSGGAGAKWVPHSDELFFWRQGTLVSVPYSTDGNRFPQTGALWYRIP
jgi:serine/threonine protein kinase